MKSIILALLIFVSLSVQAAYDPFEPDIIQVTNTLAADVNISPQSEFDNFNTTPIVNTDTVGNSFTSITSNGVVCVPGTYLVDVALYHTATSARINPTVEVTVDGVGTGLIGADGYVRSGSGHDEASTSVSDLVRFMFQTKLVLGLKE